MRKREIIIGLIFALLIVVAVVSTMPREISHAQPPARPLLPTPSEVKTWPRIQVDAANLQEMYDAQKGRGVVKVEVK